jgi:hypothetical protein
MAGQFLKRSAIIDTIKSEERTNAIQKREGLTNHPVRFTVCGCPDPNCGGWHTIVTERNLPTDEECVAILKNNNKVRKSVKAKKGKNA